MPSRGRPSSTQALLTEQYTVSRSFTEDDTIIERSLDHRDSVREVCTDISLYWSGVCVLGKAPIIRGIRGSFSLWEGEGATAV